MQKQTPKYFSFIFVLIALLLISLITFGYTRYAKQSTPSDQSKSVDNSQTVEPKTIDYSKYSKTKLQSRNLMEYAEDIVRKNKPTAPAAARFYAYVSSVYADVLNVNKADSSATSAVGVVINQIYPEEKSTTDEVVKFLNQE